MSEVMMLAKGYTPKSLKFPVYVTEKLDGAPVDLHWIQKKSGQELKRTSRQGEDVQSINHICEVFLTRAMIEGGTHIVGELYIPGKPFKYISGLMRRRTTQSELILNVFDMHFDDLPNVPYTERIAVAQGLIKALDSPLIKLIKPRRIETQEELDLYIKTFLAAHPDAEGLVIRNGEGTYQLKRSYDMQKYKVTNTVDLEIVSFEEAIDAKTYDPLHMVGRINCRYKGEIIGVGPGTMDHATRKEVWQNTSEYTGKIIEVKYMPDDSYTALREARFFRWREDKTVGE